MRSHACERPFSNARLDLGFPTALLQHERYVLCTGGTSDRKALAFAPGNKRVDLNVNLLGPLALALESSKSVKSTSFPLFKRIVEFVAIIDDFNEPVPLLSIKPRET